MILVTVTTVTYVVPGERSPVGRQSQALSTVPYSGPSSAPTQQQRSQSYRVPATSDRELMMTQRPRSITPSPMDNFESDLTRWVFVMGVSPPPPWTTSNLISQGGFL